MNSLYRLLLGYVSTLLLAAGLTKAAEFADPLAVDADPARTAGDCTDPSLATTIPCQFAPQDV